MQNLSAKTTALIIIVLFLISIGINTGLYSLRESLSSFDIPIWGKIVVEVTFYLLALVIFTHRKFDLDIWIRGVAIVLVFRALLSAGSSVFFLITSNNHPGDFIAYYNEALYNYFPVFLVQILMAPTISYFILNKVFASEEEEENLPLLRDFETFEEDSTETSYNADFSELSNIDDELLGAFEKIGSDEVETEQEPDMGTGFEVIEEIPEPKKQVKKEALSKEKIEPEIESLKPPPILNSVVEEKELIEDEIPLPPEDVIEEKKQPKPKISKEKSEKQAFEESQDLKIPEEKPELGIDDLLGDLSSLSFEETEIETKNSKEKEEELTEQPQVEAEKEEEDFEEGTFAGSIVDEDFLDSDFFNDDVVETPKTREAEEKENEEKEIKKKKAKAGPPSSRGLAQSVTDMVKISVRKIIDYNKDSDGAAVLNKLVRRGADYKLELPVRIVLDQLAKGKVVLTADYIYNQIPIELVNFLTAEQGANLRELNLEIPLKELLQQISPSLLEDVPLEDQEESPWLKDADQLANKLAFEETEPKRENKHEDEKNKP